LEVEALAAHLHTPVVQGFLTVVVVVGTLLGVDTIPPVVAGTLVVEVGTLLGVDTIPPVVVAGTTTLRQQDILHMGDSHRFAPLDAPHEDSK
jgi:hypothetical protein